MLAVRVANNGQQFALAEATDFAYYAPPEVSSFSPTSGPAGGGTRVTVYGAHFANGHAPFCRFPTPGGQPDVAVNATRIGGGGGGGGGYGLVCVSPTIASVGALGPLEITLNGHSTQATNNCVEFTYYDM